MLRAKDAFAQINAEYEAKLEQCDKKLLDILSDENIRHTILDNDILSVEQLAEYGIDDLLDIAQDLSENEARELIMSATQDLSENEARELIMSARQAAGWLDEDQESAQQSK